MTDKAVRAPRCPLCDQLPHIKLDGQYFCGNDACNVLLWDPQDTPARFKAEAQHINLGDLLGQLGVRTSEQES